MKTGMLWTVILPAMASALFGCVMCPRERDESIQVVLGSPSRDVGSRGVVPGQARGACSIRLVARTIAKFLSVSGRTREPARISDGAAGRAAGATENIATNAEL